MKNFTQNKPAFTMFELVMAIVVLGILASVAMPRLNRDHKQDASDNILADIRHTQSLALSDFKHQSTRADWQRAFWQISFNRCANGTGIYQQVGSDMDYQGAIGANESARDSIDGKDSAWMGTRTCANGNADFPNVSNRIFLTYTYGVIDIDFQGSCAGAQHIGFDHLGRLHQRFTQSNQPDYASYLTADCTIVFTMSDFDNSDLSDNETFSIVITPETGYAQILDQNAS